MPPPCPLYASATARWSCTVEIIFSWTGTEEPYGSDIAGRKPAAMLRVEGRFLPRNAERQ